MESFFEENSICRDLLLVGLERGEFGPDSARRARQLINDLREVRLISGQEENLLSSGRTLSDVLKFLHRDEDLLIWISDDTCLVVTDNSSVSFIFGYDVESMAINVCGGTQEVYVCSLGAEALNFPRTVSVQRAVQLLAKQPITRVRCYDQVISTEMLEILLEANNSKIRFVGCHFPIGCCQLLGSFHGELALEEFILHDKGRSLFEQILQSRGPTSLSLSEVSDEDFDVQALQTALKQSRKLKKLEIELPFLSERGDVTNIFRLVQDILGSRQQEHGLRELSLRYFGLSEEKWQTFFKLLANNPKLEKVYLYETAPSNEADTDEDCIRRTRPIVDAMRTNEILSGLTITEDPQVFSAGIDREIFERDVMPCLRVNALRRFLKDSSQPDVELLKSVLSCQEVVQSPTLTLFALSHFHDILSCLLVPKLVFLGRKRRRLLEELEQVDQEIAACQSQAVNDEQASSGNNDGTGDSVE